MGVHQLVEFFPDPVAIELAHGTRGPPEGRPVQGRNAMAETEPDPNGEWALPWDGGCRCGATRFRVTKPPLLAAACHCTGCQRMSASAFSLTLSVPADGFELVTGETVRGGLSRDMHHFCPSCLSWVFTKPTGLDWLVNVRATMLDDHGWFEPFIETFTAEKLPWASTPARHSYERLPDLPEFEPLIRAYQAEGKRPGGR
jgi:hypothetical protein